MHISEARGTRCILDLKAELGEGLLWDHECKRLLFVDIEKRLLYRLNPDDGSLESREFGQKIATVALAGIGEYLLVGENEILRYRWRDGVCNSLTSFEDEIAGNRGNDGASAPDGSFWFGSISGFERPGEANLYRLDSSGRLEQRLQGATISNGIAWSPDGRTMFWVDTPERTVFSFSYDPATESMGRKQTTICFPEETGYPDGMCADAEGMLWVAHFKGWGVSRNNPSTGEMLDFIRLPVRDVTCCAFGGENLESLYIISARFRLNAEELINQPLSGGVFCVNPGVRGRAEYTYAENG
jgi:sugar lactone lactonase YvrE